MDQSSPGHFGLRSPYAVLAAVFAIDLVVFMDRNALSAALVPIKPQFDLTDTAGGLLVSAYSVSYCAALPLVGWLSDRIPRKYVLAGGIGIWSLTSLATGLAQSWEQLFLARCLNGIGEASCAPTGLALIADCFPPSQRSRALAALFAAIPIGSALGFVVGGQAAQHDWRWAFYVTGALGMLAACSALAIREPKGNEEIGASNGGKVGWTSLLVDRSFVFTTLGMALMVFALMGWNFWMPTFLARAREMELDDAGTYLGVLVVIVGLGGAALGGWLGDRLGSHGPAGLLRLVAVTTLAAVPCLGVALWSNSLVVLFAALALGLTLIFLSVAPLDTVLVTITSPRTRGRALALNVLLIHLLGEMPGPIVVGALSDATDSLAGALGIALAVLLVSGLVFFAAIRSVKVTAMAANQE